MENPLQLLDAQGLARDLPLRPVNLEQELIASEIPAQGIELLRSTSAGISSVYDFAQLWRDRYNLDMESPDKVGYALGIDSLEGHYQAARLAFRLYGWAQGLNLHNLPEEAARYANQYLEKITATASPIVFFVPPVLFSYPGGDITKREMEWYLRNAPEGKATHTHFVFGLYNAVDVHSNFFHDQYVWRVKQLIPILRTLGMQR